jgi:hypothetical protein
MRFQKAIAALTVLAALAGAGPGYGSERLRAAIHPRAYGRMTETGSAAVSYAYPKSQRGHGRYGAHFAELVGDPDSGLGFYPLPWVYRVGAWRERQRRAYNSYNAVRFAIMSTTLYANAWWPYGFGPHRGVFNPYDGYGTPFFAGYYGPAGDPGAARGPLGRPYN